VVTKLGMLLCALGLFVAGSAACAVASTLAVLICARALQGFGAGGLMTMAQALLGPRRRLGVGLWRAD
jgi:MFS family permease